MTKTQLYSRKAIYSHMLGATLGGDVRKIAQWLKDRGFTAIWAKVADGPYVYQWNKKPNVTPETVDIFHEYGIAVIGWGFLYGKDPMGEAGIAVSQTISLGLDGYIFDCEGTFDGQPTAKANSYMIANFVRTALPDTLLGYCGWPRYWSPSNFVNGKPTNTVGNWHPVKVAKAFMTKCDFFSPMIYPEGEAPALYVDLLNQSFQQWRAISDKPFIPAGRAYIGDAGKATRANILAFQGTADQMTLPGISWWFLDHAVKYPEIGNALKECGKYTPPVIPAPQPEPPVVTPAPVTPAPVITDAVILARLWAAHPELH